MNDLTIKEEFKCNDLIMEYLNNLVYNKRWFLILVFIFIMGAAMLYISNATRKSNVNLTNVIYLLLVTYVAFSTICKAQKPYITFYI